MNAPFANLIFNDDGTLDPEQLEGLPDEMRARVTSPEFVAMARKQIAAQRKMEERRESVAKRFTPVKRYGTIRHAPQGVSRREYRETLRAAKRVLKPGGRS